MSICPQRDEVVQAVRSGRWPHGCIPELREHVAACTRCAEEARMLSAFAASRNTAIRLAAPPDPGLLWWKAQLRRRREAMERLERPGFAISTITIAASVLLLSAVLAATWNRVHWLRLLAMFSPAGWNVWAAAPVAVLLCGFATVALVVGLGLSKERG